MYNFFANTENVVLLVGLVLTFVLAIFAFFAIGKTEELESYWDRTEKISEYTTESFSIGENDLYRKGNYNFKAKIWKK